MKATPPGPERDWVEMLPQPWSDNPDIVLVLAPVDGVLMSMQAPGGEFVFNCMEYKGDRYGLQVLKPVCDTFRAQELAFQNRGIDIVRPAYRGPLSDVPQKLLMTKDFVPLFFRAERMGADHLNLRAYAGTDNNFNIKGSH